MATQVVTGETRAEFMASKMGISPVKAEAKPDEKPADPAKPEEKSAEAPKEEVKTEHEVKEGERIRLKSERKEGSQEDAQQARAELEKLRKELEELKKPQEPTGKPDPAKFTDMAQYAEALADWKLDEKWRAREQAEYASRVKAQADAVVKHWNVMVKETAAQIPDYEETVKGVDIPLTNELRDAILESEIGPRIQYYLAKNPEEVDRLTSMTVRGMQRSIGKLEAKLEAEMAKRQTPSEESLPAVKIPTRRAIEAPEPISPLNGTGLPGTSVLDASGNVVGSFKDYKQARRAGKIN